MSNTRKITSTDQNGWNLLKMMRLCTNKNRTARFLTAIGILLFMVIPISCFSNESDVYGVYESKKDDDAYLTNMMKKYKENSKRRQETKEKSPHGLTFVEFLGESFETVYVGISVDADSLIFTTLYYYTISPEEFFHGRESELKCPNDIFLSIEPIIEGYLCARIQRHRITSFELVKNLDEKTNGTYPSGYKISYATESGQPGYVVVLKHTKEDGNFMLDINDRNVLMKRSYSGNSAKNYISKKIEDYKKSIMEYKKIFEKELAEFIAMKKSEEEAEQRAIEEAKKLAEEEIKRIEALSSYFTDSRDGKKYRTVKIGTQTWMAENLNYAGKNNDIGYCYDKNLENCEKYGALYTWNEAMKGCPSGWHLPSNEEWENLITFAGKGKVALKKLRVKSWTEENCKYTTEKTTGRGEVIVTEHDDCSLDEFGFSALPGGRDYNHDFINASGIGERGYWWSATQYGAAVYSQRISYGNVAHVGTDMEDSKDNLLSVRCLRDLAAE